MSDSSVSKTTLYGKTINAIVVECLLITSFFILFHSGVRGDSFRGLQIILLILYPFGISLCTGFVIASIAERKQLVRWKWGMLASALTLMLMLTMVSVPSRWSGLAFLIAPLVTMAVFFVFMNSHEKPDEQ